MHSLPAESDLETTALVAFDLHLPTVDQRQEELDKRLIKKTQYFKIFRRRKMVSKIVQVQKTNVELHGKALTLFWADLVKNRVALDPPSSPAAM